MKFKVSNNKIDNYKTFIRRAGYALIYDRRQGVESFVRRLGEGHYPRFHLYIDEVGDSLIFNLHLDQKRASYQGFKRHNAEYDNEIIVQEINRLKSSLGLSSANSYADIEKLDNRRDDANSEPDFSSTILEDNSDNNVLDRISSGNLDEDIKDINNNKPRNKFWIF